MNMYKQKKQGLITLDNSLLVKKINRESRQTSRILQLRAKSKSQPYSQKIIKNKNIYPSIEAQSNLEPRKRYNSIKVKLLQKNALRMSESSCEKSYDSSTQKEPTRERLLIERAKQFVSRLKKEKRYRQGRFLLKKKEEEKKHQSVLLRRIEEQKYKHAINKQFKMAKVMDNILMHEERINSRLSVNFQKIKESAVRHKTQGIAQQNESYQLRDSISQRKMNDQTEKVLSLQWKIKKLSEKIRQMYSS